VLSESAPVGSVAVVGAGLMGRRLAGLVARSGVPVTLVEVVPDVLEAGLGVARTMAPEGRISGSSSPAEGVAGVDLVIEAIVEDLTIKQDLFAELGEANAEAILCSNSSVLPITAIAERVADGSRCVGTHFWNPPDLIPIVEVVRGARTSDMAMDRVYAFMSAIGKLPVRVEKDVPGFVGNRLQHALWREAIDLVATGVCDAETVDLVVRNTIGLRLGEMGPIENADYVGLDLTLAIHEAVLPDICREPHASAYLRDLVEHGQLGAKTGHGFLDWPEGARERAAARLSAHVQSQLAHSDN
jgi:3-hydroxybutyryl-CoA dehydrogenase